MKYRNVSGEAAFLPHLQALVEPDEVVTDVDDGTFRTWPESLWEPIGKVPPLPDGLEPYPPDEPPAPAPEPAPAVEATTTKQKG